MRSLFLPKAGGGFRRVSGLAIRRSGTGVANWAPSASGPSSLESGAPTESEKRAEVDVDMVPMLVPSKPPPTPRSSCSSSTSTRSSLMALPDVALLAIEPARLRA